MAAAPDQAPDEAHDEAHDEVAPRPAAPSLVRIGMVVWLASELMFFSGLFAAYYFLRGGKAPWPPAGVELGTVRAAAFTAVLIASSATVHLAGLRAEAGDERGTRRWTVVTIVMGAAFLGNQAAEYAGLSFTPTDHAYGSLFYLMTGFHGAHVLGGLFLLATMVVVATGRTSKAPLPTTMSVAIYYWHFVDVVWVAMFATLYLVR
ncbi:MAG: cytochrome c oxidase subunit 3 [Acidimicrobiales bacterium]